MLKVYEYSHLGGSEILQVRYPQIMGEIDEVVRAVKVQGKGKISKEKTRPGLALYDPKEMNARFKEAFGARNFREMKDTYTITIPNWDRAIPGAFKQVDFVKDKVLVEVQFGKYAFMFYDMAKFQYFFNESKAEIGVEIVPCHALKRQMASGVSYGEQLVYDIERLRRHFPAVLVKIILIDVELPEVEQQERERLIAEQGADESLEDQEGE